MAGALGRRVWREGLWVGVRAGRRGQPSALGSSDLTPLWMGLPGKPPMTSLAIHGRFRGGQGGGDKPPKTIHGRLAGPTSGSHLPATHPPPFLSRATHRCIELQFATWCGPVVTGYVRASAVMTTS